MTVTTKLAVTTKSSSCLERLFELAKTTGLTVTTRLTVTTESTACLGRLTVLAVTTVLTVTIGLTVTTCMYRTRLFYFDARASSCVA